MDLKLNEIHPKFLETAKEKEQSLSYFLEQTAPWHEIFVEHEGFTLP